MNLEKLECVAWRYIAWGELIVDITASGYRLAAIARALNVPPTTLDNWRNGHEPRYSHGEALLLLHSRVLGADYTKNRIIEFRRAAINGSLQPKGAKHAAPKCSPASAGGNRPAVGT